MEIYLLRRAKIFRDRYSQYLIIFIYYTEFNVVSSKSLLGIDLSLNQFCKYCEHLSSELHSS